MLRVAMAKATRQRRKKKSELFADSLIQEIYRLHNLIAEQGKIALESAIKLGELLILQKSRLEYGKWQEWTKRYLPDFSASTLFRYMWIYEHRYC